MNSDTNTATEDLWPLLKNAIQDIQRKNNESLKFEELYRDVYTMVRNNRSEQLYRGIKDVILNHLLNKVRKDILSCLRNNFLRTLIKKWDDFQLSMVMIRDVFMYLDRVYVSNNNLLSVYNLGLTLFRNEIVKDKNISLNLRSTLLRMIMTERKGEKADRILIRSACDMLITLGIDSNELYEQEFETAFLEQAREFYKKESYHFLSENDASSYIQKVTARIQEESERSRTCLGSTTEERIIDVLEEELVRRHIKLVMEMEKSGIFHMLKNKMTNDLASMYQLFSRTDDCLKTMADYISIYLRNEEKNLLEDEERTKSDWLTFVEKLLNLLDKFDLFISKSFKSDKYLQKVIINDFEYLLNLNPKSAEYLSLFIDDILKKKAKDTEDKTECIIDRTLTLFRYLQDKDMFLRYYKQHMAKRLLLNKRFYNDSEQDIILKLKNECGSQYTFKLEQMMKDMLISDIVTEDFKNRREFSRNFQGMELNTKILTSGFWPTQMTLSNCIIPENARKIFEDFKKFYLKKYCGRKLILQPQLGWADVSAEFYGEVLEENTSNGDWSRFLSTNSLRNNLRKYILQVTTYQMCILLLFNSRKSISFDEIAAETDIPEKDLEKALQVLTFGKPSQKILLKSPEGIPIQQSHAFAINESFTSKLYRVKIQSFANRESSDSNKMIQDKINDGRKHQVEAVIVKTMKAVKEIRHSELISSVIQQLKNRFNPSISMIKTRIESLIEREYLARKADDKSLYFYVQ